MKEIDLDEDMIYDMYYDMEFSLQKIADVFGVADSTIYLRMKKNGWILRDKSEVQLGEKNHNWKGDNVGIKCIHKWIIRNKPKPEVCEECREKNKLELSFNHLLGEHTRNIKDYIYLCRSCHEKRDINIGVR